MDEVRPDINLRRDTTFVPKLEASDIYQMLKRWQENDCFDDDHIGAICRDLTRAINDVIETPEGGKVIYLNYDSAFGNSYAQSDFITQKYGDKIEAVEEMRDVRGYLKQWRVVLKGDN